MTGYAHPRYAESLGEFGTPRQLPRCGGWVLERPIPGFPYRDAMGCYPLFACPDWSGLRPDLDDIAPADLLSITLVTDPFGNYDETYLRRCFRDLVRPFKEHLIVDLRRPKEGFVSRHHRYYARRALRRVDVEPCPDPQQFQGEWIRLYATLVERRHLQGIKAFSPRALSLQLSVPGMVVLRAVAQGDTVGAHLWYVQGEIAYSHLAAFSPQGYALMASYALYDTAIDYFAGQVRWLALGAGAGAEGPGSDGLAWFKRGWSSGTRTAYLCGRIYDPERYAEVSAARGSGDTAYFPAYRRGEFG